MAQVDGCYTLSFSLCTYRFFPPRMGDMVNRWTTTANARKQPLDWPQRQRVEADVPKETTKASECKCTSNAVLLLQWKCECCNHWQWWRRSSQHAEENVHKETTNEPTGVSVCPMQFWFCTQSRNNNRWREVSSAEEPPDYAVYEEHLQVGMHRYRTKTAPLASLIDEK